MAKRKSDDERELEEEMALNEKLCPKCHDKYCINSESGGDLSCAPLPDSERTLTASVAPPSPAPSKCERCGEEIDTFFKSTKTGELCVTCTSQPSSPPPGHTPTPCERIMREQITTWCAVHNKHYSDCYIDILNATVEKLKEERDAFKALFEHNFIGRAISAKQAENPATVIERDALQECVTLSNETADFLQQQINNLVNEREVMKAALRNLLERYEEKVGERPHNNDECGCAYCNARQALKGSAK